jgi:hypothetical protein
MFKLKTNANWLLKFNKEIEKEKVKPMSHTVILAAVHLIKDLMADPP